MSDKPVILFACVHNGGRSVAGKVLAEHYGAGSVTVRSAGSEPGDGLNPAVVQVLVERGLSTEGEHPKLLTYEGVQEADVVITMGCGETCPVFPGKRYEDWQLDDPKGQDVATVRRIVDDIDARVRDLLARLDVDVAPVRSVRGAPTRCTGPLDRGDRFALRLGPRSVVAPHDVEGHYRWRLVRPTRQHVTDVRGAAHRRRHQGHGTIIGR